MQISLGPHPTLIQKACIFNFLWHQRLAQKGGGGGGGGGHVPEMPPPLDPPNMLAVVV